jgi:peptidoglycan/LPS O-acetylase OafA/YrhL
VTEIIKNEFNTAAHGLRGIASLMVFFAHLLGGAGKHVYSNNIQYLEFIQRPWNFGIYGVELFFVISGFVIVPSILKYSPRNFAARRFIRLYPLFLIMTFVFVILNAWTLRQPELNDPITILSALLFLNLFTGTEQITPNAWTLTYEVMFYVIICYLFYSFRLRAGYLYKASAIGICIAFVGYFPIALYFAIGVVIRYLLDNGYCKSGRYAKALEITSAASCIYFASEPHFNYTWEKMLEPVPLLTMLSTAIYLYLAVSPESITTALAKKSRIIAYFGVVSFSLYLVHPYVYLACRIIFVKLGLFSDSIFFSMILFFLIATPLTVFATHIFHIAFERGPYKYIFGGDVYKLPRQTDNAQRAKAV